MRESVEETYRTKNNYLQFAGSSAVQHRLAETQNRCHQGTRHAEFLQERHSCNIKMKPSLTDSSNRGR